MITVHMIGNAHIDPAWLWRWPVGVGESLATCRTACDLLDENPDVVFTRSDAWLYERIETLDPDLFSRIRAHILGGQWAVVGGWYVQPDCNLPLLESYRKHMEIGRRHAREKLGVEVTVGYNVDSFGHNASLPDLLAEAGYDSYVMSRPGTAEMSLPAALFRWRGRRTVSFPGSPPAGEVLTWRIPYGYGSDREDLSRQVTESIAAAVPGVDHVMCFYGVGDHGGGPTRAQIGWIRRNQGAFEGARLRFSHPRAFFDCIKGNARLLPVVQGELGPHAIGCYSVVRSIKTEARRAEHALLAAERAMRAFPECASRGAADGLETGWKQVLFNHFHDVYGGTSLSEACEDAVRQLGAAREAGTAALYDVLYRVAGRLEPHGHQRILVYNPSAAPFAGFIQWEPWLRWLPFQGTLLDGAGEPVVYQSLPPVSMVRKWNRLLWEAQIPAGALQVFTLRTDLPAPPRFEEAVGPATAPGAVSNGLLSVTTGTGALLAVPGLVGAMDIVVQEDTSDTWGHDIDRFAGRRAGEFKPIEVKVEERGVLRSALRVESVFGRSTAVVWARVYRGVAAVELELLLDWRERSRVAKIVFRSAGEVTERIDGIPGGGLDRPQDGREFPMRDWTVGLSAGRPLVAIASPDCLGISGESRELRFTALRSPPFAWHDPLPLDPERSYRWTDQGEHVFRFVVRPGDERSPEQVNADSLALHDPPICMDWTRGMR